MLIWLLAVLIIGSFAAIGYSTGVIRSFMSFLGVLIATALAPVGIILAPLFVMMGVTHPIWLVVLPILSAWVLIWAIIFGIGFALHRPVELHFKYKEDDATRKGFETLSQASGMFLGLISGILVLFTAGKFIYVGGYLTTQTSAESEPGVLGWFNKARQDMDGSGWDSVFAALDKTPKKFYQVSDVLGLLYHNPLIHGRAADYPPFLALTERQEFKDIAADADLLKLLTSGGSFMEITGNSKIHAIALASFMNQDIGKELLSIDLEDFKKFLETGKSKKYDEERILGRWRLDPITTLTHFKRTQQNVTAAQLTRLKFALTNVMVNLSIKAYVDEKLAISMPAPEPPPKPAEDPAAATNPYPGAPGMSQLMAQRYGVRPQAQQPAQPRPAPKPAEPSLAENNPYTKLAFTSSGFWTRVGDGYIFADKKANVTDQASVTASFNESGRMVVSIQQPRLTLFFVRAN